MGMEVNGVAAASSYQSQNLQAAKPVSQVSSVTSATDKSNEVIVDSAKSAASNVAVSVGQAADSEKNGSSAKDNDKAKKQAESMADVKDIRKVLNNNTIAEFGYNEPSLVPIISDNLVEPVTLLLSVAVILPPVRYPVAAR